MAKLISVKIPESELKKIEASARTTGQSRNAYINKALRFYNRLYERKQLAAELRRDSELVGQGSLAVLREFDAFQDEGL